MSAATVQIVTPENAECDDVDFVAGSLYTLSRMLGERNPDAQVHGVLGGQWGYGQHFENDVFEMHPYYWGDCTCGQEERDCDWVDSHAHADGCYQTALRRERLGAGLYVDGPFIPALLHGRQANLVEDAIYDRLCAVYGVDRNLGCAVHCTCDYQRLYEAFDTANQHDPKCPEVVPNFRHKRSGFEARWYKWIGRGMEFSCDMDFAEWTGIMAECVRSISCPE